MHCSLPQERSTHRAIGKVARATGRAARRGTDSQAGTPAPRRASVLACEVGGRPARRSDFVMAVLRIGNPRAQPDTTPKIEFVRAERGILLPQRGSVYQPSKARRSAAQAGRRPGCRARRNHPPPMPSERMGGGKEGGFPSLLRGNVGMPPKSAKSLSQANPQPCRLRRGA